MTQAGRKKRLIVVVTGTHDQAAKQDWIERFSQCECEVRFLSPDKCRLTLKRNDISYFIDDVNPAELQEGRDLVRLISNTRPASPVVVLVGKEDWDDIRSVLNRHRGWIHVDGEEMDQLVRYLAAGSETCA